MTVGGHLNNLSLFRVNSQAIFTREGQDCVRLDLGRFDGLRERRRRVREFRDFHVRGTESGPNDV